MDHKYLRTVTDTRYVFVTVVSTVTISILSVLYGITSLQYRVENYIIKPLRGLGVELINEQPSSATLYCFLELVNPTIIYDTEDIPINYNTGSRRAPAFEHPVHPFRTVEARSDGKRGTLHPATRVPFRLSLGFNFRCVTTLSILNRTSYSKYSVSTR